MKKYSLLKQKLILLALLASPAVFAQDADTKSTDETAKPVRKEVKSTFENPVLINNQTVMTTPKQSLEFMIQHRFGVIEHDDDLYGLFGPSNIRLGLDYGITKRLSVGIGATKNKQVYGVDLKYALLKQNVQGGSPVSVSVFGNLDRSAASKTFFQIKDPARTDKDTTMYESYDRFSYFAEVMIARKINDKISVQLAGSFSHFNLVDSGMQHDVIGVSFAGRYKFSPQSSVLLEFDYPVVTHDVNKNMPNLSIGYEVATSGHTFQVFLCTADGINNQEIMVYNQNDFTKKQILLGFNITRLWNF
jgi:hypothetical protein